MLIRKNKKEENQQSTNLHKNDSCQRFSSFQTPPLSEEEDFSDYDSPQNHPLQNQKQYSYSQSADKSLQCDILLPPLSLPPPPLHLPKPPSQFQPHYRLSYQAKQYNRFNYLKQIDRIQSDKLSSIKQQINEESPYYNSKSNQRKSNLNSKSNPILIQDCKNQVQIVQFSSLLEKDLIISRLQKENMGLKSRVVDLELAIDNLLKQQITKEQEYKQLRVRYETLRKEQAIRKEKHTNQDQKILSLSQEIMKLNHKCITLQSTLIQEKLKHQTIISKMTSQLKHQSAIVKRYQQQTTYKQKFIQVFLSMLPKINLQIQPGWSIKKQIAIGWKVVKFMVRKALKLGVKLPILIDKDELDNTKFFNDNMI